MTRVIWGSPGGTKWVHLRTFLYVFRCNQCILPALGESQEQIVTMSLRLLMLFALLSLVGCQGAAGIVPDSASSTAVPTVSVDPVTAEPAPEPLAPVVPDACELLLIRLEETRPMLENLDESLLSQAERFDAAISSLNQPIPEPKTLVCPPNMSGALGGKEIIGAIEWVYMDPPGRHFRARIDSGTETSSLSASELVEFERDGDDWVRFFFQHDSSDEAVEFELPIKRTVLIRKVSSEDLERRYVVDLDIRLGEQLQTTEFTLTNRGRMTYPILLGRTFLLDLYVIDVSRSYTHDRYDAT